jgi:hypothetical protein
VLELGPRIAWRKELVLSDGADSWTIAVQDAQRTDRNGLYREQLPADGLTFRKAKALGLMSGRASPLRLGTAPDCGKSHIHVGPRLAAGITPSVTGQEHTKGGCQHAEFAVPALPVVPDLKVDVSPV